MSAGGIMWYMRRNKTQGWAGRNTNSIRLRTSEKPRPVQTRQMTEEEWKNRKRKG